MFKNPALTRRPKAGRPTKFVPERIAIFIEFISKGTPTVHACHAAGWSPEAFYEYKAKGINDISEGYEQSSYAVFVHEIEKAEAIWIAECMGQLWKRGIGTDHKPGPWQIWAWLLERRYPEYFGQHTVQRIQHAMEPKAGSSGLDLSKLSPEQLVQLRDIYAVAAVDDTPVSDVPLAALTTTNPPDDAPYIDG